jgi:KUP system potassium uptake protein
MPQTPTQGLEHPDSPAADGSALPEAHHKSSFRTLTLGALGVVYGDIGTSPLYALRESVQAASAGGPVTRESVIGVLSLMLWSLILVVTLKYVVVLLRADNNGEGGTLTLVALAQRVLGRGRGTVLVLGAAGAGLFYGDAMITPAISVLSAVEGLKIATPALQDYVVPITLAILVGLFAVQSRGTGKVAALFGPVMLVWFATLAFTGLLHIADDPGVFLAINPFYGLGFLWQNPGIALAVLGGVCLVATGAEALYADLGHFGRGPIRMAWGAWCSPPSSSTTFGQGAPGAGLSRDDRAPVLPLVPEWATLPLVGLATWPSIIAAQAVITGAFSLTRQAVQLGLLPRLEIRFTSASHQGQIYLPRVNALLLVGVIILVLDLRLVVEPGACLRRLGVRRHVGGRDPRHHRDLEGLALVAARDLALILPFLTIDLAFFGANLTKLFTGGYVPVLLAIALILVMLTWVRGTRILFEKTRKADVPVTELIAMLGKSQPHRVKGTAVFLTSDPETAPSALLHNLKHNKVLHEKNVILTVKSADEPRMRDDDRVKVEHLATASGAS